MTEGLRTITVDMNRRCRRCRRPGAVNNGLCLRCIEKAIMAGEFDHILRPASENEGMAKNDAEDN